MFFSKKYTVHDLKPKENSELGKLRDKVKVLIIDDEEFKYMDIFRSHGYNPVHVDDLENINFTEQFGVILCDIKGVGKKFASKFEGAHLIQEIRNYYPLKIIIGYTAHQFDADYNKFFSLCDDMVKKDIDSDDWIEKIDLAVLKCCDPEYQWRRIHKILAEKGLAASQIAEIENDYVRRVMGISSEFPSQGVQKKIPSITRDMLINLASSAIFKLIVG